MEMVILVIWISISKFAGDVNEEYLKSNLPLP